MNLPNKITISRILLAFIFMFFIFCHGLIFKILALIIFSLAAVSDYYDGFLAKTRGLISDFGKIMDPIADKILVLSAFLAFVQMQLVEAWMVVVIIFREFLITSLRLYALNHGKVLAANRSGKHKTISQMVTIFLILIFIVLKEVLAQFNLWKNPFEIFYLRAIYVLMLVTVSLTIISGLAYLWENRKLIIKV